MNSERERIRDLNTLSTYLDGTLNKNQRNKLELRLVGEPELRQWLENLRQTKILLGRLPRIRAPHNFTLTPEMVPLRTRKKQPMFTSLRLASSLAAVLLVVLLGVQYLFVEGRLSTRSFLEAPMMESVSEISEASPEPLIQWGEPKVEGGGAAMGGEGVDAASSAIEEPIEEIAAAPPEEEIEAENSTPAEKRIPEVANEMESFDAVSDTEDDLILGINPEQAGEIIDRSDTTQDTEGIPINWQKMVRWAQIALAGIALSGGLALWILRRKQLP
ncbi:MAG: hypothetical protein U9R53_06310 [Chloroflexota bacterium]|nr:hypothetical protein [Chloroflexota bacterium]